MNVTKRIVLDMAQSSVPPTVYAVQGDNGTRVILVELRSSGLPWLIPEGISLLIHYRRKDGTGGSYDTLPNGTKAWSAKENILTIFLVPQLCDVPGIVSMELTFLKGKDQLSTFQLELRVSEHLPGGKISEDYTNLAAWLHDNTSEAERNAAEQSRIKSEQHRVSTESARNKAEAERNTAELLRAEAETKRENILSGKAGALVDITSGTVVQIAPDTGSIFFPKVSIKAALEKSGPPSPDHILNIIGTDKVTLTHGHEDAQTNPSNRTAYNISLPQTSYGGYIDWEPKKYVQTHRRYVLDHPQRIDVQRDLAVCSQFSIYTGTGKFTHMPDCISDMFPYIYNYNLDEEHFYCTSNNFTYIWIRKDRLSSVSKEGFNSYITEHPITFVCELMEPIEYDLPDLPRLVALPGTNTIYSDQSALEVTYHADLKAYIDRKISELASQK